MDDRELVVAAQRGNRDALRQLLDIAVPRVYSVALNILRNEADAEDVVHESVIAAMEGLGGLRNPSVFSPWFLRIVVNRSKNLRNRAPRDIPLQPSHENVPNPGTDSERSIDIQNAIDSLGDPHKQIVELSYSGLNAREIADMLNRPSGTVRRILSEAYRMLSDFLGPDYGGRSERHEP